MKKLLLIVAVLFSTYAAQAQGIKLGLKAGANLSNWTGDDIDEGNPENLFGPHAGGFLDYGISEMISIRPELLYSMRGFKVEEKDDDIDLQYTTRGNYLDLPIMVRVNAGGLFFEGGPTISYLLNAKSKAKGSFMGEDFDESETVTENFNKLDFGYAAGLGYEMGTGLGIGLRYNGGLNKLFEEGDEKVYNSVFQLYLSYTLGGR